MTRFVINQLKIIALGVDGLLELQTDTMRLFIIDISLARIILTTCVSYICCLFKILKVGEVAIIYVHSYLNIL